jgi:hypothetical protein
MRCFQTLCRPSRIKSKGAGFGLERWLHIDRLQKVDANTTYVLAESKQSQYHLEGVSAP